MRSLPLLVLISGPPGAGKSTLAVALSAQFELPLLRIDQVKSGVAFTMTGGTSDERAMPIGGPAGQAAFLATYELVNVCVKHGVSLILEKAWFRGLSEAELRQSLPTLGRSRSMSRPTSRSPSGARYCSRLRSERTPRSPPRGPAIRDVLPIDLTPSRARAGPTKRSST